MVSEEMLEQAARAVDERCGLEAMWLFGSVAEGRARADSDLDLAVLVRRPPSTLERLSLAQDLATLVGREVDLVILNDASPILARQVLAKGRLLVNHAPRAVAELTVRTVTDYADLKLARAGIERALEQRVGHG